MEKRHIPGLSASIVIGDTFIWRRAYGYADIENEILVTNKTLFKIASVSKTLTATCLMQLYESGYFDLHDWARANYLPEYLINIRYDKYEVISVDEYPLEEIINQYGCYLKNSIPMILAYAGYENFKEIYLWGCDREEYINNPEMGFSLYYILGQLRKEGRKVFIVNQFNLDNGEIYGFMNMKRYHIPEGFYFK